MIYKYLNQPNGEDSVDLLKKICEQGTLCASDPKSFNDPFEFKVNFNFDAEDEVIERRYFDDNPDKSRADYDAWRSGFDEQFRSWLRHDVRPRLLSSVGAICFTQDEANHLMWSHYAGNHQGFCIGFEASQVHALSGLVCYGPVRYQTDAPEFSYYADTPDEFVRKASSYKSSHWSYEREYRVVLDRQGIVEIGTEAVKEVVLGCRAFTALRQYANHNLSKSDCHFFQMIEDFGCYSLLKSEIKQGETRMSSHF